MDSNMDINTQQKPIQETPAVIEIKKKKKKKKLSYKDMMADILKPKITEEERIKIKKDTMKINSLGGGSFAKMEKI